VRKAGDAVPSGRAGAADVERAIELLTSLPDEGGYVRGELAQLLRSAGRTDEWRALWRRPAPC